MSRKREQHLDFTVHYSHYQDVAHVFQSHVVRWLRTGFPVHGSCDERITPVLYKACAEPIINQYGFRGCSIARSFNEQITLGTHVIGKRWHRVLETTQKKSAGTSRSTPQFHVKNGMIDEKVKFIGMDDALHVWHVYQCFMGFAYQKW